MTYRPLGDSGLMVSAVGIGCKPSAAGSTSTACAASSTPAHDAGVTLLDTADIYGDQRRQRGDARRGARGPPRRSRRGHQVRHGHAAAPTAPDHGARGSRRYVRRAVEASPAPAAHRPHRPLPAPRARRRSRRSRRRSSALTDLVREGKVRYVGCSNFAGWQVADADWTARTAGLERFVSRAEPLLPARPRPSRTEVVPACERFGLGLLPYFPLEYGLLTGKYRRGAGGARAARARGRARRPGWRTPTGTGSRR